MSTENGPRTRAHRPLDVVIVDDAVLFRDSLAMMLVVEAGARVRTLGDAAALLEAVDAAPPDVAIVDIRLPPTFRTEGLDAAAWLREHVPRLGVLVLSAHLESLHVDRLLRSGGGFGYLLKDRVTGIAAFVDALRTVAAGGTVVDPEIIDTALRRRPRPIERLTDRELEVLRLMALGRSNQAICTELAVSPKTLETHVRAIFNRLDLAAETRGNRRVLAVLAYLREIGAPG